MSKLHGLDAYGYVVNAWLDGELETSGLSEIPALGWFWSDLLKHRMWMIDELENWAGIIREDDQPVGDGEEFIEQENRFDPQRDNDDTRPVDDFEQEGNADQERPGREDIGAEEPTDNRDPREDDDTRPVDDFEQEGQSSRRTHDISPRSTRNAGADDFEHSGWREDIGADDFEQTMTT